MEHNIQEPWEHYKKVNMYIMGIAKEEEREKEIEKNI